MKVLSIGNSFSQDAQRWLHQIAAADGVELYCANLYIGGCTLQRHYENSAGDVCAYAFEENGCKNTFHCSIRHALQREAWDAVTIQQSSGLCGIADSYEPYLTELVAYVRQFAPQAKLYFHQTWAYEEDYVNKRFEDYHNSQQEMYERLQAVIDDAAERHQLVIIPVGAVIQHVRRTVPAFDHTHGGMSLNRDGYHLTPHYGRYLAGLVWYHTLTGRDIRRNTFVPQVGADMTERGILKSLNCTAADFAADADILAELRGAAADYLEGML